MRSPGVVKPLSGVFTLLDVAVDCAETSPFVYKSSSPRMPDSAGRAPFWVVVVWARSASTVVGTLTVLSLGLGCMEALGKFGKDGSDCAEAICTVELLMMMLNSEYEDVLRASWGGQ